MQRLSTIIGLGYLPALAASQPIRDQILELAAALEPRPPRIIYPRTFARTAPQESTSWPAATPLRQGISRQVDRRIRIKVSKRAAAQALENRRLWRLVA